MSFGKIFESTFTGSMAGTGPTVFALWSYVIANTRPPGVVELNPTILAAIIGTTIEEIEKAMQVLLNPDPRSRSKEHDGRRLLCVGQFTYEVPTWQKYRLARNDEDRRAYNRAAKAKSRSKKASMSNNVSMTVNDSQRLSAKAEAEAEAEAEALQQHLCTSRVRMLPFPYNTVPIERVVKYKRTLGDLFGRHPQAPWNSDEEHYIVEIMVRPDFEKELDLVVKKKVEKFKYFPKSLTSLLRDWTKFLDQFRAPTYESNAKPNPRNVGVYQGADYGEITKRKMERQSLERQQELDRQASQSGHPPSQGSGNGA